MEASKGYKFTVSSINDAPDICDVFDGACAQVKGESAELFDMRDFGVKIMFLRFSGKEAQTAVGTWRTLPCLHSEKQTPRRLA